ncbi:MAG: hypothetical protein ABJ013_05165 [Halioglobus sp.]
MRIFRLRHNFSQLTQKMAICEIGLAECGIAVIMLIAGFIGLAENFFELWRSADIGGSVLSGAYRYGGVMVLLGILIGATDEY